MMSHFLRAALGANFQIASSIKADGKPACILLVSQKMDKTQYTSLELDFLYIISNIASLALDNIHQYSTIEKLSYTDSMTQIYNYRYFTNDSARKSCVPNGMIVSWRWSFLILTISNLLMIITAIRREILFKAVIGSDYENHPVNRCCQPVWRRGVLHYHARYRNR